MRKLCVKLPPFSPDYSGVCSALFDLNCVTVLHDASGCTGNYTGYDEPRWYGSRAAVFCSGLRELDAVLGDDEKMIQKTLQAAESLKPDLIALIGSPVPMVIGTDLKGIAADIELRTGRPCLGFDTTGTKYYSDGVSQACMALAERFTRPPKGKNPRGVNLLGLTPLDYDSRASASLKGLLKESSFELIASFCDGLTLPDIENAAQASVNLVVSQSGIPPAHYFEQRYGIPYVVGMPMGRQMQASWHEMVLGCIADRQSAYLDTAVGNADTLVLGDAVFCKAMQLGLKSEFGIAADCGCLFGTEAGYEQKGMLDLCDERTISAAINSGKYRTVIGDPMFRLLVKPGTLLNFIDNPIYCVSSKMAKLDPLNCIGEGLNKCLGVLFTTAECL
ncbi:MAG TPA: nitrogenase component 1 [Clostridia bacterium]|nr:nitrogenase component 1 [Clostridia bacterium]